MKSKSSAFTLLEVLIAVFIIAIALSAVLRATNNATRIAYRIRTAMAAHWVGENALSELQIGMIAFPESSDSIPGKSRMMGEDYTWVARNGNPIQITVSLKNKSVATVSGFL